MPTEKMASIVLRCYTHSHIMWEINKAAAWVRFPSHAAASSVLASIAIERKIHNSSEYSLHRLVKRPLYLF